MATSRPCCRSAIPTRTWSSATWAGAETPSAGVSRSGFDPPEAGFEQLRQQILAVKPTVVVVGYGMADSFAGEAGLPAFEQGLAGCLNVIDSTKARVVFLVAGRPRQAGPRRFPTRPAITSDLARYRDVIKHDRESERRPRLSTCSQHFVDLYRHPHREHSLHETLDGQRHPLDRVRLLVRLALSICKELDQNRWHQVRAARVLSRSAPRRQDRDQRSHEGISRRKDCRRACGSRSSIDILPLPFCRPHHRARTGGISGSTASHPRILRAGNYELKIDGKNVSDCRRPAMGNGVVAAVTVPNSIRPRPCAPRSTARTICSSTAGGRRTSPICSAFASTSKATMPSRSRRFDPLVAEQEKLIARLKKPVPHVYELSRVEKEVAR